MGPMGIAKSSNPKLSGIFVLMYIYIYIKLWRLIISLMHVIISPIFCTCNPVSNPKQNRDGILLRDIALRFSCVIEQL
jgi:hypothetical protein